MPKRKVCDPDQREEQRELVRLEFVKRGGKCVACDEDDFCTIDWHHLDPTVKNKTISQLINSGGRASMLAELEKCVPICSNCHRKLHNGRFRIEDIL